MSVIQSCYGEYEVPEFLYNFYRESGQILFMPMLFTRDTCRKAWSDPIVKTNKEDVFYGDSGFPEAELHEEFGRTPFVVHNLGDTLCTNSNNELGCLFSISYKANSATLPLEAYLVLRQSLQFRLDSILRKYDVSTISVSNAVSLEAFGRYIFNVSTMLVQSVGVDAKFKFTIKNGMFVLEESADSEARFSYMASAMYDSLNEFGGTDALCSFLEGCEAFDKATFCTLRGSANQRRRVWIDYCNKYLLSEAKKYAEFWINALNGR